jgi:colanic acid biosynthesis glycosyl transferase WcaI
MRITIIHMRYLPDLTGTGPLVAELASDLARLGEEVTVITSFPHYGKKPSAETSGGWKRGGWQDGVRVVRTLGFPYGSGSLVGRALDYGLYTLLSAAAGLAAPRPDVILAVAPPMTAALSGRLVGVLRRAPLVFNAQDIWPDGLVRMGVLRHRALIRLTQGVERLTYRCARRITVLSDGMRENLLQKGISGEKVAVIPNWVDLDAFPPRQEPSAFRGELGLKDAFVVLFSGNIGFAAGLESVIGAAALLRNEPRLVFLIVGEGSAKPEVMRLAAKLDLPNVRFVTSQPAERLSEVFAAADLSLVTLRSGMGALSVPSKALAIMASGRPVLAAVPDDSDVRRIVDEAQAGRCIAPDDPAALAEAIIALRRDREQLEWFGANGRQYAGGHFDRPEIVGRYHRLLREVAGKTGVGELAEHVI